MSTLPSPLHWQCVVCSTIHPPDHAGMFCGTCSAMVACASCERDFDGQCHAVMQVGLMRVTCVRCSLQREIEVDPPAECALDVQRFIRDKIAKCPCGHDRACIEFGFVMVPRKRGAN